MDMSEPGLRKMIERAVLLQTLLSVHEDIRLNLCVICSALPHMRPLQIARKPMTSEASPSLRSTMFPTGAGILFGLGLGGFFDGIVLHQVLQWHHMVSSRYPPDSLANLRFNTLCDGLFHSLTYVFVVLGLIAFWRVARRSHLYWSGKLMSGTVLLGWGIFNLVEGVVDHSLLGVHHVNELAPKADWPLWDAAFLVWGAAMLVIGLLLLTSGRRAQFRAIAASQADALPATGR
jgi:uncharacterized membrane protein